MTNELTLVCAENVDQYWQDTKPLVERLLEQDWRGEWDEELVYGWIRDGAMEMWLWGEAMMLTSVRSYPAGKECVIWGVSGRLKPGWQQVFETVLASSGCDWAVAYGRPGFERVLRHLGWKVERLKMKRVLHGTTQSALPH